MKNNNNEKEIKDNSIKTKHNSGVHSARKINTIKAEGRHPGHHINSRTARRGLKPGSSDNTFKNEHHSD